MARRQYSGGSAPTTLNGGISSGATVATLTDGSTYADATVGPSAIVVDPGLAAEEIILYATRTGNSISGLTRGYAGTTAAAHASGAVVKACGTAVDFDEANAHVNTSAAVHGLTGSIVGTTDTQTLSNKTFSAGLKATSGGSDLTASWTTYTPTFTNITSGAGNFAYLLMGKTLVLRFNFTAGTTTSGVQAFSLPAGMTSVAVRQAQAGATANDAALVIIAASATTVQLNGGSAMFVGTNFATAGVFGQIVLEIA